MKTQAYETNDQFTPHRHMICWKSLAAGIFISAVTYLLLTALGAAIGGMTAANNVYDGDGVQGLAIGAAVWLGISTVVALFAGSFFATRLSRYVTAQVGVSHGLVLGSVFMLAMVWGLGAGVGGAATGLAKTVSSAASGAANVASYPAVQDTFQRAFGTSELKSDPTVVAQGLTTRLMQGNTQSARDYLAYQTGQTTAEVDAKITQLKAEFDATVKIAAEKTAKGVATAGWSLFGVLLIGLLAAAAGGYAGVRMNAEVPMVQMSVTPTVGETQFARVPR